MKKLISLLTAAFMIFSASGVINVVDKSDFMIRASANEDSLTSGKCGEDITWKLDEDGTLTITGTGVLYDFATRSSPFYADEKIKTVIIDREITYIGAYTFQDCSNLENVIIPNRRTEIRPSAFKNCQDFTLWGYEGSNIDYFARDNKIKFDVLLGDNIIWELNDGVLSIKGEGDMISPYHDSTGYSSSDTPYPFWGANNIKKIVIENGITSIKNENFSFCDNLVSVIIPESVKSINQFSFYNCKDLEEYVVDEDNQYYTSVNGVLYNKDVSELITCPEAKTNVMVPASVTTIKSSAFDFCDNLKIIDVDENNNNYSSIDGVLYNKDATEIIKCPNGKTTIIIPDSVINIGDYAFCSCNKLTSITIPKGIQKIGKNSIGKYFWVSLNSFERKIYSGYQNISDFNLKCYNGTSGEKYAIDNNIKYDLLDKRNISDCSITLAQTVYNYTGNEIKPKVNIVDNGKTLVENKDYELSYGNNVEIGNGSVKATGIGDYGNSKTIWFTIKVIPSKDISKSNISLSEYEYVYTGNKIMPTVTVRCNGILLEEDKDYTLIYEDNINVGTASVTVSGIGEYFGKKNEIFTIKRGDISKANIVLNGYNFTYTGNQITPNVTVKYNDNTLIKDEDYTLKYSNNVNVGTASVIVSGIGDYTGTQTVNYIIKEELQQTSQPEQDSSSSKTDNSSATDNNSNPDSKPKENSSKIESDSSKPDDSIVPTKGDVNGDTSINVTDIAITAAHIKGIKALDGNAVKAADVNNDGSVNVTDIAMIAAHIKGIKSLFSNDIDSKPKPPTQPVENGYVDYTLQDVDNDGDNELIEVYKNGGTVSYKVYESETESHTYELKDYFMEVGDYIMYDSRNERKIICHTSMGSHSTGLVDTDGNYVFMAKQDRDDETGIWGENKYYIGSQQVSEQEMKAYGKQLKILYSLNDPNGDKIGVYYSRNNEVIR